MLPIFFLRKKKDPIPKNDSGFFLVERVCFDLSKMMGIFLVERHVNLQGGGNSTWGLRASWIWGPNSQLSKLTQNHPLPNSREYGC